MPIKQRTAIISGLQVPAKKPYVPSPDAKLSNVHPDDIRVAGFFAYAGVDPMTVPLDDLTAMMRTPQNDADLDRAYRDRVRSKATAVRSFCVLGMGSAKKVRLCENVTCALWPFRMGNSPFKGK